MKTADMSWAASGAGSTAGSAAASPAAPRARCRRWAGGVLAAVPQILCQVPLGTLVVLLPLRDQVRLCLTSRSVRGQCLCHVRRWGPECWDTARTIVGETLCKDGPTSAALTAAGVRIGSVCRAHGYALDMLEHLSPQPLLADAPLLALAMVRYSLKYEFTLDQVEALGEHLRAGGCLHLPGVQDVECHLVWRV